MHRNPAAGEPYTGNRAPDLSSRIRNTFLAPGRMARDIRESAPWVDVLLLSTVVTALSVLAIPDEVFIGQMEEAVTRRGEPVEITSAPQDIARWGRAIAMLSTIATHPIVIVTIAGILTVIFGIVARGASGFREYLSLTAHGMLIPAFGSAVVFLIRLIAGRFGGDGAELLPEGAGWGAAVAASIDPFAIWMLIVLGVGINRLDSRQPTGRSVAILLVGYMVLLAGSVAVLRGSAG